MEEKKVNNLELWDRVKKTDPKYVKNVRAAWGGTMSTPNAQYQRRSATEEFGIYGVTWGLKSVEYQFLRDLPPNKETLALATGVFFIPSGEFQISSSIKVVAWFNGKSYLSVDEDFAKKVETDMVTKALSYLGFNADIFLGNWDDNKYVAKVKEEFAAKKKAALPPPALIDLTDEICNQMQDYVAKGKYKAVEGQLSKYKEGANITKIQLLIDKAKLEDGKEPTE